MPVRRPPPFTADKTSSYVLPLPRLNTMDRLSFGSSPVAAGGGTALTLNVESGANPRVARDTREAEDGAREQRRRPHGETQEREQKSRFRGARTNPQRNKMHSHRTIPCFFFSIIQGVQTSAGSQVAPAGLFGLLGSLRLAGKLDVENGPMGTFPLPVQGFGSGVREYQRPR